MNIFVKALAHVLACFVVAGCNAGELKAMGGAYGYRCKSSDGYIYSIVRKNRSRYVLYTEVAGSQLDESEITFDGRAVTDIETNGGVGKRRELQKLFKLMLGGQMTKIEREDYSTFLSSTSIEKCRFSYQYNLSP